MKNVSWQPVGLCVAAFFLHGCGSDDADSSSTVTQSNLERIQLSVLNEPTGVISASSVLPIGSHLQYQATAIYYDGSPQQDVTDSVQWNSESSEVAGIDSHGIVTAQSEGDTRISASLNGVTSSTLPLHTSSATLTSLNIEGKSVALIDLPVELKAIAVYSDHTQQDVSDFASWESTTADVMDIDKGYVTPSSAGRFEVMASYRGLSNERSETIIDSSDITDITLDMVNLDTDIPLGSTVQLASVLSIETEEDTVKFIMENYVDYDSDNAAISISDTGLLSADAIAENVTISASTTLYDTTVTDTQVVNVVGAELAPLTLSCDEDTIYLGLLANCQAISHHLLLDTREIVNEDVTALATWSVTNEEILSIENAGQVKGRAVGTSSIQVEYHGQTRTQEIQVLGAGVASIDVQSDSDFMPANSELPMRAIATMVNDETQDVTPLVNWRVSSEEFTTINHEGTLASSDVEDSEVVMVTAATIDINGAPISDTKDITINGDGVDGILPICGGAINDTDQTNATGVCLKVATDSKGNWFTSSPSIAVMENLGYALNDTASNMGKTYSHIFSISSGFGPTGGQFAAFRQDGDSVSLPSDSDGTNAGVNGQSDRWCQQLNQLGFAGRNFWRRPTEDELSGLHALNGNMWTSHGWPIDIYWTSSVDDSQFYIVNTGIGGVDSANASSSLYVSCISEH